MNDSNPNEIQVGGDHYQSSVQHWDFVAKNNIPYHEGNATRYLSRWRRKNGVQDLEKSLHYVDKIISLFEGGMKTPSFDLMSGDLQYDVWEFAKSYGLSRPEAHCCYLICSWRGLDDLLSAKETIRQIIRYQNESRGS